MDHLNRFNAFVTHVLEVRAQHPTAFLSISIDYKDLTVTIETPESDGLNVMGMVDFDDELEAFGGANGEGTEVITFQF